MKRNLLLACFGLFLMTGLFGQEVDFKYKVDSTNTNPKQYSVTITITKGTAPYNIYLYEGLPWKDGSLIQTIERTTNSIYVFKNIQPGKPYILTVQLQNNEECIARRSFKIK